MISAPTVEIYEQSDKLEFECTKEWWEGNGVFFVQNDKNRGGKGVVYFCGV